MEQKDQTLILKELTKPTAATLLPFSMLLFFWSGRGFPTLLPLTAIVLLANFLLLYLRSYLLECRLLVDEEQSSLYYQYFYKNEAWGSPSPIDESQSVVALHHHRFLNHPYLEEWIYALFTDGSRHLLYDRTANFQANQMTPLAVKELAARFAASLACPIKFFEGRDRQEDKPKREKNEVAPITTLELVTIRGTKEWRFKVYVAAQMAFWAPIFGLLYGAYLHITALFPMALFLLLASWWVAADPLALLHYLRHCTIAFLAPLLPSELLFFDLNDSRIVKKHLNWHRSAVPKCEFVLQKEEIREVRLSYSPTEELRLLLENDEVIPLYSRAQNSPLNLGQALEVTTIEPLARQIAKFTDSPLVVEVSRD